MLYQIYVVDESIWGRFELDKGLYEDIGVETDQIRVNSSFFCLILALKAKIDLMRIQLLVCLSFCVFLRGTGQAAQDTISWHYLSIEEGLQHNQIKSICQDQFGFLWIGTPGGLNRYDGYEFESFMYKAGDTTALSHSFVSLVFEDSYGDLWVGTDYGLNLLAEDRRSFKQFLPDQKDSTQLSSGAIASIFEDSERNLWIGTWDGNLHLYDRRTDTFSRFADPEYTGLVSILEEENGNLILGFNWLGILYFDKKRKKLWKGPLTDLIYGNKITKLFHDQADNIWIGTKNGLFQYPKGEERLKTFPVAPLQEGQLNAKVITDIYEREPGVIWIATDGGGINVYQAADSSFSVFPVVDQTYGLARRSVTTIFVDRTGRLWLGTSNGGLAQQEMYRKRIDHHVYEKGNETGLSGASVIALFEDSDNGIWVGLDQGGLNYLDRSSGRFTHYRHDPEDPQSISGEVVEQIYEDEDGKLYIGTYQNGFDILDKETGVFTHHWAKHDPQNEMPSDIRFFLKDKFGDFWIATRDGFGLYRYVAETEELVVYKPDKSKVGQISYDDITFLLEDRADNLWVGTAGGLNLYQRSTNSFQSWMHDPADTTTINSNRIASIYQDEKGYFWIATDKGLDRFDRSTNTFTHYDTDNGLPPAALYRVLPGSDGYLWVSTALGICRFSMEEEQAELLSLGEQTKAQQFGPAAIQTEDGKLWFGSVNGIYSFYPGEISKDPNPPRVIITKLLISNEEVRPKTNHSPLHQHISKTKKLVLDHRQSAVFSFEYVGINYNMTPRNQYAYRLAGFEEKWNYVGVQRNASYTNIDPGTYHFEVKARNSDGVWTETGAVIEISILAPWWKSTWAYAWYIIILLLAGLGIRYSEKNRITLLHNLRLAQLERDKAEEINQIKSRFFTNISHEFKTPLTLIVGPLEKMLASGQGNAMIRNQLSMMYRNAQRMLRLINQLMDFRQAELGELKIKVGYQDLVSVVRDIVRAFKSAAEKRNIELSFESEVDQLELWFDLDKIDKIMFNLISNALKHTPQWGKICVSVQEKSKYPEFISIAVEDTGRGISKDDLVRVFDRFYQSSKSNKGSGIGLALTKSLVDLHHGQIEVDSKLGMGSTFTVFLPKNRKYQPIEELLVQEGRPKPVIPCDSDESDAAPVLAEAENGRKCTVLVVEDEPEIATFIRDSLRPHFQVLLATNGKEALERCKEKEVHLVVSDIMMPEMNGLELCKHLKRNIHTSHIPVILLTARGSQKDNILGLNIGADDYISKPFSYDILLARIKNLICTRQKLKDRFLTEFSMNAKEIVITSKDEQFILMATNVIEANLSNQSFSVNMLAREMAMSRSAFSKKIKALTGQAPSAFIRTIKLKRAARLLLESGMTVSQVADGLGYITAKTFRTQFKKQFGLTPSEFMKDQTSTTGSIPNKL